MVDSESAAVIAGLSAIGGGVVVAASNYAVGLLQAREAPKTELRQVLIKFGSVVYRVDHLLRMEPKSGKVARFVNEQMARLPNVDHAIGRARRRLLEPHIDSFAAELTDAMTAASLLAPLKLLPAMEALTELMAVAGERDDDWQRRWDRARTDFFVECRDLLGSGVVRSIPGAAPTTS